MKRIAIVSLLALATAQAVSAQTNIVPDIAPGVGLGTTVAPAGNIHTIDGGTTAGTNLFHSFNAFDVGAGDVARWVHTAGDPASIGNVINRVTGGTPSSIMGVLDSTAVPNADFYFINPAGIVFSGQGAQVNVPAAAHFSTASELRFSNGEVFSVATPSGSTLSVAAPQAFGFLGNESTMLLSGVGARFPWLPEAFLPQGGELSLSAADITVDGSFVQADGMMVRAVGSRAVTVGLDGTLTGDLGGEVVLSNSRLEGLEVNGGTGKLLAVNAGRISLAGSEISTRGGTFGVAGPIAIAADELELTSNSQILSIGVDTNFTFTAAAGPINVDVGTLSMTSGFIESGNYGSGSGGDITINVAGDLHMDGSWITSDNSGIGGSVGGSVIVRASNANLIGFSRISAVSFGDGEGGSVDVAVDGHFAMTGSRMFIGANGAGNGGSLSLSAHSMSLANSLIDSNSLQGGDGGNIDIDVATLLDMEFTRITSSASSLDETAPPSGGSVSVSAGDLVMRAALADPVLGSSIAATASGTANGGAVTVDLTGTLQMTDSGIAAGNQGSGDAGSVTVSANQALLYGSGISSSSSGFYNVVLDEYIVGTGNAGPVDVRVGGLMSLSATDITSNSENGQAGNVTITTGSALLDNGSSIHSDATLDGTAGSVIVEAVSGLTMLESSITSNSEGSGSAGEVSVSAGGLLLNDSSISSASLGDGDAGAVRVTADALELAESHISSDSQGVGDAGGVTVAAGQAALFNGRITSDALGSGQGGLTSVSVGGLLSLAGSSSISSNSLDTGDAGGVTVTAGSLQVGGPAFISSDAFGSGDGGSVDVQVAGALDLVAGSRISSDVEGAGNAGHITVAADEVRLAGGSAISSNSAEGSTGDAGNVQVVGSSVLLTGGSSISSDAEGEGNAGTVHVDSADLELGEDSAISSSTFGAGDAGGVVITGGNVTLNDSAIASDATATGNAGGVSMDVGQLTLTGSSIRSEAAGAGTGGEIDVKVAGPLTMADSSITTNANSTGDAGNIGIAAATVTMAQASAISSDSKSATGGLSGSVTLTTDSLEMTEASRISTSSANANTAGAVEIFATSLSMSGAGTEISSENTSGPAGGSSAQALAAAASGDAGSIVIHTSGATIADGSRVSTNSLNGAAGNITFLMPPTSWLILSGSRLPGIIETSSGPGAGGVITIASPLAIISNGGIISALGESGGANVQIDANYFIASADRPNVIEVDGTLTFSNAIYDVAAGTTDVDLSMLDASGVLHGQCSSVRASGRISQLNIPQSGPFGAAIWSDILPQAPDSTVGGGCQ